MLDLASESNLSCDQPAVSSVLSEEQPLISKMPQKGRITIRPVLLWRDKLYIDFLIRLIKENVMDKLLSVACTMEPLDYIDEDEVVVEESSSDQIQLTIPASYRGERLDKTLAQLLPSYSRSRLQQWLERGLVKRGDLLLTAKTMVLGGESISLIIPIDPQNTAFKAENIDLDVVFEDDCVAIINKPPGMVVHPAAGNWSGTLLNGLLNRFPECEFVPRAGIVHRLDKDTSGLLAIAKTIPVQTSLVRQLQERTVNRKYLALVWGRFPAEKVIRTLIGRDPRDRLKMAVVDNPSGKEAVTHVRRLETVAFEEREVSLVVCKLETGRTHQIRVHLESIGFPIVNDPVYKKKVPHKAFDEIKTQWLGSESGPLPGQALHASVLGFSHPISNESVIKFSQPPEAFLKLLKVVGINEESWKEVLVDLDLS